MRPSYRDRGAWGRVGLLAGALLLVFPAADAAAADEEFPFDPVVLVREVVKGQRRAERSLSDYTYDQVEVRTAYGKDGRPKEVTRRLFAVFSGEEPGLATRELVAVDGRPSTDEEKREQAEEDGKARKRSLERRAAARASGPAQVTGDEDDPLVGPRRLSDLLDRFDYRVTGSEVVEGRPAYVVEFAPRPGAPGRSLADRALNALAGQVVVDASDFQIRSVNARLVAPLKVAGGLAANVKAAAISFVAERLPAGAWFPCRVDLRLSGKTALVVRLDTGTRVELSQFRTFRVETETAVSPSPEPAAAEPPR